MDVMRGVFYRHPEFFIVLAIMALFLGSALFGKVVL